MCRLTNCADFNLIFNFWNIYFVKWNFVNWHQVGSNLSYQWPTLTTSAGDCTLGCSSKWRGTNPLITCVAALRWCSHGEGKLQEESAGSFNLKKGLPRTSQTCTANGEGAVSQLVSIRFVSWETVLHNERGLWALELAAQSLWAFHLSSLAKLVLAKP